VKRARNLRFSDRTFTRLLNLTTNRISAAELRRRALVFSPHPDDESLGCGGIILKKKALGATVRLVHMTDGSAATHGNLISKEELGVVRRQEALNAACVLGVDPDEIHFLEYKDGRLAQYFDSATDRVTEILRNELPQEVFVPCRAEPVYQAADHVATTQIVLAALARFGRRITVWEYPIWFWLHWPWVGIGQGRLPIISTGAVLRNTFNALFGAHLLMNLRYYVDITEVLQEKRIAIRQHRSQIERLFPCPEWLVLGDIAGGEFLGRFHETCEFFGRYE
jgi:LmbE family N-acetylglucosaminyl deacetylase